MVDTLTPALVLIARCGALMSDFCPAQVPRVFMVSSLARDGSSPSAGSPRRKRSFIGIKGIIMGIRSLMSGDSGHSRGERVGRMVQVRGLLRPRPEG